MNIGLDIGYSHTKAVSGDRCTSLPSAVGTPDKARFSLTQTDTIILTNPYHAQVGEAAITQSRFTTRREDRHWTGSDEWHALALAAFTEITKASVELRIVTGLPVAFYDDRNAVRDRLLGKHKTQREGRPAQTFHVTDCRVIPQPFGALLAAALDDRGRITDEKLATGAIGVIDIGGKTTNLLSVNRLSEIGRETASINTGAWDMIRALRDWLAINYPGLEELRPHQIVDAVVARKTKYFGDTVDLTSVIDDTLEPLSAQVIADASQLWNGGATLDAILISGGGALLLGPYIQDHFKHARVVDDPVFANAMGFWRFSERLARI
jgi:plasmid segregation protein ParM